MSERSDPSGVDGEAGPGRILAVRALPGANCSSVGSVIDMLFVAGAVGGALLVAVTAALSDEERAIASRSEEEPDEGPT